MANSSLIMMLGLLTFVSVFQHEVQCRKSADDTKMAAWKPQPPGDTSDDVKMVDCRNAKTPSYFEIVNILYTKARDILQILINPHEKMLFNRYDKKIGRKRTLRVNKNN